VLTPKKIRYVILTCFFLSGMASLVYQVLWVRQLGLVFGNTLYSVSTVLGVFMAGLALGSYLFGRLADRTDNPLRLFALLEIGIGLYVLAIPFIFRGVMAAQIFFFQQLPEGHASLNLVRIVLCFLALLFPTTLMGGTLPVIAKFYVRSERALGGGVAVLYFVNTLGAVLGSFLAGFALIPLIGVLAATLLAATVDLAIGVGFFTIQRRLAGVREFQVAEAARAASTAKKMKERKTREAAPNFKTWRLAVLVGFSLAGLASLSLEVSWTRVLTLVFGNSVYAFSLMLTAFLLGIAVGSFIAAKFVDRSKNPWRDFVLVEAFIGISVIVLNPVLGQLPLLLIGVFSSLQQNFWALQTALFSLSFLIMLVPTTLMGAAFPIAARIYAEDISHLGTSVGQLYAGNTLGAMVGPLFTGFVIIPLLGIQKSIFLVALIYLTIAGTVFLLSPLHRRRFKSLAAGALAIIAVAGCFIPTWDPVVMNSGVYIYAGEYSHSYETMGTSLREAITANSYILFHEEGRQATVSVSQHSDGNRALRIDGKVDATSYSDLSTELLLGHLPMLLHPEPKTALVVGLGSGITLGAVTRHASLESVVAVEIEPAVIDASAYFARDNNNALADPRLRIRVADARNYMLASTEEYDVITAEPSNPWLSGSSVLFTKEQFELYKQRLRADGIIAQWVHYYSMSPQDLRTVINTFVSVFPHTTIWQTTVNLLLIGSQQELRIDLQALTARFQQEQVRADLERVGIESPYGLLGHFLMDEQSVRSYSAGAPLHTDNRPILEFSAPKHLYETGIQANLAGMVPYIGSISPLLTNVADPDAESEIQQYVQARSHSIQALRFMGQDNWEKALAETEEALVNNPGDIFMREMHVQACLLLGQAQRATRSLVEGIDAVPSYAPFYAELADIYQELKQYEEAIEVYGEGLKLVPDNAFAYYWRGFVHLQLNNYDEAVADLQKCIELAPNTDLARHAQLFTNLRYKTT
jgi:spermidine synthase